MVDDPDSDGADQLKIEDILPFFPDFVKIADFKDEICDSLDQYNAHIEKLKKEMDEYTQNANMIRKDITQLRNRFGYVGMHSCLLRHPYCFSFVQPQLELTVFAFHPFFFFVTQGLDKNAIFV
jgi:hypothetical protein